MSLMLHNLNVHHIYYEYPLSVERRSHPSCRNSCSEWKLVWRCEVTGCRLGGGGWGHLKCVTLRLEGLWIPPEICCCRYQRAETVIPRLRETVSAAVCTIVRSTSKCFFHVTVVEGFRYWVRCFIKLEIWHVRSVMVISLLQYNILKSISKSLKWRCLRSLFPRPADVVTFHDLYCRGFVTFISDAFCGL
jgi:hypothetical protein